MRKVKVFKKKKKKKTITKSEYDVFVFKITYTKHYQM